MSVMVSVEQSLTVEGDDLHTSADRVMHELVVLSETEGSGVLDSEVYSDSDAGKVTLEVTVDAEDLAQGVTKALNAMRTAIHAAGDGTPDWPTRHEVADMVGQEMSAALVEACPA